MVDQVGPAEGGCHSPVRSVGPRRSANPEEIKTWLEWAGQRLLSMDLPSAAPQGFRSFWPEYPTDVQMAYGYSGNRLKAAIPRSKEISLMDEILELPGLVPNVTIRRIINARALLTPISNRHLYSWTRIAFINHSTSRRIVILHRNGLAIIASQLLPDKASTIRQSIAPFLS